MPRYTVRLEEVTYVRLVRLLRPRETFSMAVKRLIDLEDELKKAMAEIDEEEA